MGTAQVIQLPGAAESKVLQTRVRGRLPNFVARLRLARCERDRKSEQEREIEAAIEAKKRSIARIEEFLIEERYQLYQLRNVQPGTQVAVKVCEYLEWSHLSREEREYRERLGYQPKEWPL